VAGLDPYIGVNDQPVRVNDDPFSLSGQEFWFRGGRLSSGQDQVVLKLLSVGALSGHSAGQKVLWCSRHLNL
jgi:hypothetical protein